MTTPKFVQIATSAYSYANYTGHISLFGLTADGEVYEWRQQNLNWQWCKLENPEPKEPSDNP